MPYVKSDDVKQVLGLSESEYDTEIGGLIASAEGWAVEKLKPDGLSWPSTVPQVLCDAVSHYAAFLFRRRRDPAGAAVFKAEAEEFLQVYIEGERDDSGLFRAVNA